MSDKSIADVRRAKDWRDRQQEAHERDREIARMSVSERIERAAALQWERQTHEAQQSGTRSLDAYYEAHQPLTGFAPAIAKEERRKREVAESFRYDPEMETMLTWETKGDPKFDTIDPTTRMSLGLYRRSKQAAKDLGFDVEAPDGA